MPGAKASASTRETKTHGGLEGLRKRLEEAKRRGGHHVKVGLPAGSSPYPDGTSVILVGAVHEFGSEDGAIPERSWLRSAMRDNDAYLSELIADLARSVTGGARGADAALELLGTEAAALVQDQLRALQDPPLKPATVREKGSSNPLIDTAKLIQAITYEVVR